MLEQGGCAISAEVQQNDAVLKDVITSQSNLEFVFCTAQFARDAMLKVVIIKHKKLVSASDMPNARRQVLRGEKRMGG